MRAAVLDAPGGGPHSFRLDNDFPDPAPGPGEVLVRVAACSLNHLDLWVRRGLERADVPFPHICGSDIAGTVASGSQAGRRVMIYPGVSCGRCLACSAGHDSRCDEFDVIGVGRQGGYAELVVVPERNLFDVPEGWSDEEAAAFPLTFLTAWHGLSGLATPAKDVLVWGASGGLGTAAVQVARAFGARVAAATTSATKAETLRELGAIVSMGKPEEVAKDVLAATGGVDVVVDPIGREVWSATMQVLRKGGTVLSAGDTAGSVIEMDLPWLFIGERRVVGVYMGGLGEFHEVHSAATRGRLRPVLGATLSLEEVGRAHALVEERAHVGKVVLEVS